MAQLRAAIIGCGRTVRPDGQVRRGISYNHAKGYTAHPGVELVALADIKIENAQALADEHKLKPAIYADYREMIARERLDLVSVCTWPKLHAEMVRACAEAGVPRIHCEKPMAPTWGEAKRMAAACEQAGVTLSFNHQRRFGPMYRQAKALVDSGAIGELRRIEFECGNLYDWGTHWFDISFFYVDNTPAEWVIAQIDKRTDKQVFGMPLEDQGLARWGFANGVQAYMEAGEHAWLGASHRLVGSSGVVEIPQSDRKEVRWRTDTSQGWTVVDSTAEMGPADAFTLAIADVVDAALEGREPLLSAARALQGTEVMFGAYESSRRGKRIDLPLAADDAGLITMLAEA